MKMIYGIDGVFLRSLKGFEVLVVLEGIKENAVKKKYFT